MARRLTEADFRDYAAPGEVAAVLGVSREAIVVRTSRGRLPFVQTPLGMIVHLKDVLDLVREREARGIPAPVAGLRELRLAIDQARRKRRKRYVR